MTIKHLTIQPLFCEGLIVVLLLCPLGTAQEAFYLVAAAYRSALDFPWVVAIQAGTISDFLLRGGVELPLFMLSGDATFVDSYRYSEGDARFYAGVGAGLASFAASLFEVHGVLGAELKQANAGYFFEYQPGVLVSFMAPADGAANSPVFGHKLKIGVNIYY